LKVENSQRLATHVRAEFAKVIIGQPQLVDQLLLVLFCGGHALMEGVPGLAKTLAVKTLARICGLGFQRVQCTADLMPADVMGTNVFDQQQARFAFRPGPVFAHVVLVDEINRASPKTQSGLLECMQEARVTVDGRSHPLPVPFLVLATQNPVEYEGTYPLPEAQLDRFTVRVSLGYPPPEQEAEMLSAHASGDRVDEHPRCSSARLSPHGLRCHPGLPVAEIGCEIVHGKSRGLFVGPVLRDRPQHIGVGGHVLGKGSPLDVAHDAMIRVHFRAGEFAASDQGRRRGSGVAAFRCHEVSEVQPTGGHLDCYLGRFQDRFGSIPDGE